MKNFIKITKAMAQYRRVRDEIRAFVETLPEALEK